MDTKLAASLQDLEKLFGSRMQEYEAKLLKATSGAASSPSLDISSVTREFFEFKQFVCQALSKMKTQIELLAAGFDRHETALRRKVLLIHGVPENDGEKLPDVVQNLMSEKLKLTELSKGNNVIHVCHRLGYSQQKARPILIRFFKMENRQMVWECKKALKGTGITISEFLTQARHRIFMAARTHFGMLNCWSMEGRIVVVCPDKSRRKIETTNELHDLIAKFPSSPVDTGVSAQPELSGSPVAATLTASTKYVRKTRMRKL